MTSATTPVSGQREPELAAQTVVVIGGSPGIGLDPPSAPALGRRRHHRRPSPGPLTAAVHNTRSASPRRSSLSSLNLSGDYAVRPPSMYRISPVTYGADSRYRTPSTMSLT